MCHRVFSSPVSPSGPDPVSDDGSDPESDPSEGQDRAGLETHLLWCHLKNITCTSDLYLWSSVTEIRALSAAPVCADLCNSCVILLVPLL